MRWSDEAMTYLSYSRGFKGGGYNSHFNAVQTPQQLAVLHKFGPEKAESIEVGFKLDLLDRTLRLNGAIFTTDYTDLQITYRIVVAPYLTNAGEASIDGFELEGTWLPTDQLAINASVGHLDAQIDKLDINPIATPPGGLVPGNDLPFAPDWQASAGIAYTIAAGKFEITPRVDVSYQTKTYFDAINTRETAQLDDYTLLNASVRVGPETGSWKVTAGVNNATDELYAIAGNSSLTTGSGYAEIAYARPREWFTQFTYEF
jgi:iron complex outermembrane recepter protein